MAARKWLQEAYDVIVPPKEVVTSSLWSIKQVAVDPNCLLFALPKGPCLFFEERGHAERHGHHSYRGTLWPRDASAPLHIEQQEEHYQDNLIEVPTAEGAPNVKEPEIVSLQERLWRAVSRTRSSTHEQDDQPTHGAQQQSPRPRTPRRSREPSPRSSGSDPSGCSTVVLAGTWPCSPPPAQPSRVSRPIEDQSSRVGKARAAPMGAASEVLSYLEKHINLRSDDPPPLPSSRTGFIADSCLRTSGHLTEEIQGALDAVLRDHRCRSRRTLWWTGETREDMASYGGLSFQILS